MFEEQYLKRMILTNTFTEFVRVYEQKYELDILL